MLSKKAQANRDYRARQSELTRRARVEAARAKEELRAIRARGVPEISGEQVEFREEWLASAVELLRPVFAERGYAVPAKLRVSLGWPRQRNANASCFPPEASADKHVEVFVSPELDDPAQIVSSLTHELCHAAVGCEEGHRRVFTRCARDLDLVGQPSCMDGNGNPEWHEWADPLVAMLGAFPHAAIVLPERAVQSTRMKPRKCSACGFTFRAARAWIESGELRCPRVGCDGVPQ
jgi:hypothetical protein